MTAQAQTQPHLKPPSPQSLALKPTYSQVLKVSTQPRDPGKPLHDPLPPSRPHDQARDQTPDLSCDVSCVILNTTQSCDQTQSPDLHVTRTRMCQARHPLLHMWKTVGVKCQEGIPHSLSKATPLDAINSVAALQPPSSHIQLTKIHCTIFG